MRRPLAVALVLLVVLGTVPLPVSAHSNHLTATNQVSDDGTLLVETVFVSDTAHLVVHADDDGQMGEALGSRLLTPSGLVRDTEVRIDPAAWEQWDGNRTVWVALHADDGDGEYDAANDTLYTRFNRPVAQRIVVGKGDPAIVTGSGFRGQFTDSPELTVGRVTLPDDGVVVARDNETGAVVGTRALGAGTHQNVTVGLNESFFAEQDGQFVVRTQLYHDDGDGAFSEADRPMRVGDQRLETTLPVVPEGRGTDTGPAVNTPGQPRINTPADTTSPASASDTGATSSGSGPGFGVTLALVGATVGTAVWFARRMGR